MENFERNRFLQEEEDLLDIIRSGQPKANQQLLNAFNANPVAKNYGLTATFDPNTGGICC